MTENQRYTRRRVLSTVAGIAGGVTLSGGAANAAQETDEGVTRYRLTRQMVVPEVEPFDGNLVGQFVIINFPTDEDVSPSVVSDCEFPDWSAEQTKLYEGMLLDRLRTSPQYVRVDVYMNANQPTVRAGAPFVISDRSSCPGDFAGVSAQSVPESVTRGEPGGPTVTGS